MSEIEKLAKVQDKSQAIGEFIEWLGDNNMAIVRYATKEDMFDDEGERNGIREGDYLTMIQSIEKLLAKYFKIDLNKVEKEKRELLAQLQKLNEERASTRKLVTVCARFNVSCPLDNVNGVTCHKGCNQYGVNPND
jgi:hypothetical protein